MGAKLKENIHHSNINDKWAKINTDGKGKRMNKRKKESLWDVYRKEQWFWEDRGGRNNKCKEWKPG